MFLTIGVTSPEDIAQESYRINRLLDSGALDYIHIRKPSSELNDVRRLIEEIDFKYRSRIRLHGHFALTSDYNIAGVHLNSRCPVAPPTARQTTRSCHSIEELSFADCYEYVTLSPIFDSLSKPGYGSAFCINKLKPFLKGRRVVALGGVTPDKFVLLKQCGFIGGAMLGYLWNGDIDHIINNILMYKTEVSRPDIK